MTLIDFGKYKDKTYKQFLASAKKNGSYVKMMMTREGAGTIRV